MVRKEFSYRPSLCFCQDGVTDLLLPEGCHDFRVYNEPTRGLFGFLVLWNIAAGVGE